MEDARSFQATSAAATRAGRVARHKSATALRRNPALESQLTAEPGEEGALGGGGAGKREASPAGVEMSSAVVKLGLAL